MFGDLSAWGKFWVYLGALTLAAAAGMSFMVGWKMTALHALFLACLSFVTAFIPEAAYRAWNEGKRCVAVGLTVLALPLFAIEFVQHAAYTAGIRGHELATTRVQNVRYDDARDDVTEARANHAMFTKRLADLEAKQGWAASATADGLRANLDAAQKAIDLETARGGCKAKCLGLMKEQASLNERIKTLEARDDYTARIEAAKAVIARAREKSAGTEHKSSQTEHMNGFLSKAVALVSVGSTKPDEITEDKTQLSTNLAIALAGTGLPALAFFVAGLYRRREEETNQLVPTVQRASQHVTIGRAVFPRAV
jgi:BMFP domain-containing protein YqiC